MTHRRNYIVADYMKNDVKTVAPDDPLRHAVAQMIKWRTNGLVVVEDKRKVVGILSGWDIIAYVVPDYLELDKHLATFESADVFQKRVQELADHPVWRFMTSKVHTTKPSHSLMEAAALLSEFRIRQLPVVDDNDLLLGYINRTDIKKAIAHVLGLKTD